MSSARYFFASTASVNQELGNIQSFVTSALVAQWNLREAVEEYVKETGVADYHAMQQKFVRKSGVESLDLSYTCLRQSWPQQKEQFAKFYLFEVCTFYEAWLDEVVPQAVAASDKSGQEKQHQNIINWLQFPTGNGPKESPGLAKAIREVNQDPSPLLKKEFFPQLSAHRKNSWSVMDNCLKAYRAFKEIRNSFIHQGGKATDRAAKSYSAMMLVPTFDLGLRRPFSFPPIVEDVPIVLDINAVTGFANIVSRIIVTLDAALAVSKTAENDLIERLRCYKTKGGQPISFVLPVDPVRRSAAVRTIISKVSVPSAGAGSLTEEMLKREHFTKM